jgi:hypothetical protein
VTLGLSSVGGTSAGGKDESGDELDWDQPALGSLQLIAHRLAGNEQRRSAARE